MIVLEILGWVLLGLLALLVLLLVCPVTIRLRLDKASQLQVWVRVLFVRLRVFPLKPRKPKAEKPKKAKAKKQEDEAEAPADKKKKKQRSPAETVALIKRLAKAGLAALGAFMRHLKVRGVELVLPVHAEEASDTAVRCGQLQTAVGAARAVLDGRLNIRYKQLQLVPDFTGNYGHLLLFACKLRFQPGILFVMGWHFLKSWLATRRPYSKAAYKRAIAEKQKARAAGQNGRAA